MTFPEDFEWGGPDIASRQARLDAAFDAYEARHYGTDDGRHHMPYVPDGDPDPPGWDEERIRRVLEHYEQQSEEQAALEDDVAASEPGDV